MKVRRPWFKFWPDSWLSARSVALMTPAQKGVYIDLLCLSWQEGFIPTDSRELAYLLRLPHEEFEPLWNVVKKHFKSVKNSPKKLVNQRLEDERSKAQERSDKTRKAAQERWDKSNANAYANAQQTQCSTEEEEEEERREKKKREKKHSISAEVASLWDEFNAARMACIPGAQALAPSEGSTKLLRDRLKAGETAEGVRHVIAVYAAEVRKGGDSKHFNSTTPFRPENFARALSQPLPKAANGVKSAAQILAEESKRQREAEFEGTP